MAAKLRDRKDAANSIRQHCGIENSALCRRRQPRRGRPSDPQNLGVCDGIRSFAANILRLNHTHNVTNTRSRIAIGRYRRVAIDAEVFEQP
jgi:hypothetical protein